MCRLLTQLEALDEYPQKRYTRPALKKLFLERSGLPDWLLARSQRECKDLAETLARCWPVEGPGLEVDLVALLEEVLPACGDPAELVAVWNRCRTPERIWVNRLLLGHYPKKAIPPEADPNLPRREVRAELMYALLTAEPEFSFGLNKDGELLVFARCGTTDPELTRQLLRYIEEHTVEKKGPVRVVSPGLAGRISFTGTLPSTRHKSGCKVQGARLESLFPPGGLWSADRLDQL